MYQDIVKQKLESLQDKGDIYILGIESSCDETSVAVVKNGREVLSNVIASQIDIHTRFGGVVPEVASRNHVLAIENVYKQALQEARISIEEIDAIAVTYGAGLIGALMVGVAFAKGLAYAYNKPLIAVNHIRGHICANLIEDKFLEPPFACLVVSGGHTAILGIDKYNEYKYYGSTVDDAIGEAFDKVARVIGLGYPGGPKVDKLSKQGQPNITFVTHDTLHKSYNCSYSGLKTAVINYVHKLAQNGEKIPVEDICASFTRQAIEPLVDKALKVCEDKGYRVLCLAGGVASNSYLREYAAAAGAKHRVTVKYPSPVLCTDNAAMIAACGYFNLKANAGIVDMSLDAVSNLPL